MPDAFGNGTSLTTEGVQHAPEKAPGEDRSRFNQREPQDYDMPGKREDASLSHSTPTSSKK